MHTQNKNFKSDILIVDDKLENIKFLSNFLSQHNYQVRKAINGKAALIAVETVLPDLILLDINMPEMGGYEVCETLKKDPRTSSVPIIFLSAGNEIDDKIKAFAVGGIDYITKPFFLEEVLIRIETQLQINNLQTELETRNKELENTVALLQKTQSELIKKEKLVNAGRIAAGISHEINNPLTFILCNLNPASEYAQKLIKLIHLYQQTFPDGTPDINNFIDDEELEFINSDLQKIIGSMHTGAERIRAVIQALHTFSQLDKSGVQHFDIQENIDIILSNFNHQLQLETGQKINIVREYQYLPEMKVYVNIFNRAISNILQNAIDAVKTKLNYQPEVVFKPTIYIHVKNTDENKIRISIKDNGIGISEENKNRIFDPFFTTKPIKKGTGLGLFTSHQIINDVHKGSLIYQECFEGGAEFIIEVPID